MSWTTLINGSSATIVFGGTVLATVLRCGITDTRITLSKLAQLGKPAFDADNTRAKLAVQVQEIRRDGLLRTEPRHFDDNEFSEATDALIGSRSVEALVQKHEAHRARRLAQSEAAVRTLAQAAELAPVFGLAGTLISLSQLPVEGIAKATLVGAIGMAVTTTLYGLLAANLLFAPLARIVERAARAEEAARQDVIDWLTSQLEDAVPPRRSAASASETHHHAHSAPQQHSPREAA